MPDRNQEPTIEEMLNSDILKHNVQKAKAMIASGLHNSPSLSIEDAIAVIAAIGQLTDNQFISLHAAFDVTSKFFNDMHMTNPQLQTEFDSLPEWFKAEESETITHAMYIGDDHYILHGTDSQDPNGCYVEIVRRDIDSPTGQSFLQPTSIEDTDAKIIHQMLMNLWFRLTHPGEDIDDRTEHAD